MTEVQELLLEQLFIDGKKGEVVSLIEKEPNYHQDLFLVALLMSAHEIRSEESNKLRPIFYSLYKSYQFENNEADVKLKELCCVIRLTIALQDENLEEVKRIKNEMKNIQLPPEFKEKVHKLESAIRHKKFKQLANILMWSGAALVAIAIIGDVQKEILRPLGYAVSGIGLFLHYYFKRK